MISKHRKNIERSKTAINILPYLFQPLQNILPGAITADFFQQAIRQAQEATTGNQVKSNNTKNEQTLHHVHAAFKAYINALIFLWFIHI